MSEIRPLEDDSSEDEERRVSLRKKELEVFVVRTVHQTIHQVMELNIVPLISKIVKQEFDLAAEKLLTRLKHNSESGILHSPESRSLQLRFLNTLSLPVFTGQQIIGEGQTRIRVALVDGNSGQVVTSGPEASAKVEIVVLEGDFDGDETSNWTVEEFNNKIVREKEGRKSLLTGHVCLNLKDGIGSLDEISFVHNANWMKSCLYRLGARVVDSLRGHRVREAMTKSFVVRDRRNTLYEKHYPPSQYDEVWRLVQIGKGGRFHDSLERQNVRTVKDFLTQYYKNPQWLRDILGTGMNAKKWEATVDHARTCILDKSLHLYFTTNSQKKNGIVFNDVGQLTGLLSECCYIPIENVSEADKADAHKLVESAFDHMEEVKHFDDENSMRSYLRSFNASDPSNTPRSESPTHCYIEASHTEYGHDPGQPSTSSHETYVMPTLPFHLSNAAYPSNSPRLENGNNCNPGIWSFDPSFGSSSDLNETGLHSIGNEGPIFDLPTIISPGYFHPPLICFPPSTTQSFHENEQLQFLGTDHYFNPPLICFPPSTTQSFHENDQLQFLETDHYFNPPLICFPPSTTQSFHENEQLQFLETDHSLHYQNSTLESEGDLLSIYNGFLSARSADIVKAQRRWTMLFSVLRSKTKIAAWKLGSSEEILAPKRRRIC